ncbi:MAG: AzlC family ABC transporter permease [Betaproteobacteria bacterium]|nr:AzlC family ABC transporter permease [Betaproteobacteria bacterium]
MTPPLHPLPLPLPPRLALRAGASASLPLLMAVVPFGVICGASAASIGLSFAQAWALSWMVFAGSAQIVATQLLASGAPAWVIVLTGWVVNLRFMMYSAALAPHFRQRSRIGRWLGAYLLTDQAFAVTLGRIADGREQRETAWFYLGLSLTTWLFWQVASIAGILLGSFIPASWSMDFVVALTFIALLAPLLGDRLMRIAAVVGGAVALAPQLPFKLNLIAAALCGAGAALLLEKLWTPPTSGRSS